jgi:hypothetical protein
MPSYKGGHPKGKLVQDLEEGTKKKKTKKGGKKTKYILVPSEEEKGESADELA